MPVNVLTEIEINQPIEKVAAFTGDPDRAPGNPSDFFALIAPFMAMRKANRNDSANLKKILERP